MPEEKRKDLEIKAKLSLVKLNLLIHFPLKESLIEIPKSDDEVIKIFEKLGQLNFSSSENKAKLIFLFLWLEKHPADTRVPNHSIYEHLI